MTHVRIAGLCLRSPNRRESWYAQAARRRRERTLVTRALEGRTPPPPPWDVLITRVAPTRMDSDQNTYAAKTIRDAIAAWLGCDDGPDEPAAWWCDQRVGAPAVEITVTTRRPR